MAPWVAYFSSILVWLGRGDPPVIFLVAFVCMPVFVFAAVAGLRSADPAARELLASVDASRVEVLWRLRLPAAVPSLLATARYVTALALAAYYGEGGNLSNEGLGAIGRRAANGQNAVLWATVLATVLLGVAGLALITSPSGSCCAGTCHNEHARRGCADGRYDRRRTEHGPGWAISASRPAPACWQSNRSTARTTDEPACLTSLLGLIALAPPACGSDNDTADATSDPPTTPPAQTSATTALAEDLTVAAGEPFPQARCDANRDAGTITYLSGFDFAATASIVEVVIAEQAGYFDELCLDVELQPSFSTANYLIVASGEAQFAARWILQRGAQLRRGERRRSRRRRGRRTQRHRRADPASRYGSRARGSRQLDDRREGRAQRA